MMNVILKFWVFPQFIESVYSVFFVHWYLPMSVNLAGVGDDVTGLPYLRLVM
jgi:hypothetical protein